MSSRFLYDMLHNFCLTSEAVDIDVYAYKITGSALRKWKALLFVYPFIVSKVTMCITYVQSGWKSHLKDN